MKLKFTKTAAVRSMCSVSLALSSALLGFAPFATPPALAQSTTSSSQSTLRRPANPEATGMLVNLLARYADNVADKTDLDRAVEKALKNTPGSRETARKMVNGFNARPLAQRQAAFGNLATISTQKFSPAQYESAFKRAFRAKAANLARTNTALPMENSANSRTAKDRQQQQNTLGHVYREFEAPLGQPQSKRSQAATRSVQAASIVTMRYVGLYCYDEMTWDRGSNSDEIYILTSAVYIHNGQVVTNTLKHPVTQSYYGDVDRKESRYGPLAPIYYGSGNDVSIITTVMERDDGDPNAAREYVDAVVKAGAAVALYYGVPIPSELQNIVGDAINALLGTGDDTIATSYSTLYANDLEYYAGAPWLQFKGHNYNGFSRHDGGGARYYVFWDVVY